MLDYFVNPYTVGFTLAFAVIVGAAIALHAWRNRGKDEPTPKVRR